MRKRNGSGTLVNLAGAGNIPSLETSINQLQELYRKKYLEDRAEYVFEVMPQDRWRCDCICGRVNGYGDAGSKTGAKKKAAYMVLVRIQGAFAPVQEVARCGIISLVKKTD